MTAREDLARLRAASEDWATLPAPAQKAGAAELAERLCTKLELGADAALWRDRLREACSAANICTRCLGPRPAIRCGSGPGVGCGALFCCACAEAAGRCPFCGRLVVSQEVEDARWSG